MNKLELVWLGKGSTPVEPRLLIENKNLSFKVENNLPIDDSKYDNMLIHGDNLLALKALEHQFDGQVKFIYIDPPYNTQNAFSSYDDGVEHSTWLNLMKARLEIMRSLLSPDGLIAVQIDNAPNSTTQQTPEFPYLFVLMDEIFGRSNFVSCMVWKKKGNPGNTAKLVGTITESILVYAKDKNKAKVNKQRFEKAYKYHDELGDYNLEKFLKTDKGAYQRDTMKFPIVDPKTGTTYLPPEGMRWTFGQKSVQEYLEQGLIVFKGKDVYFKHYKEGENEKLYNNLLLEHGSLKSAKDELEKLGFNREDFETPKPEVLLMTLIEMFTSEGDLVLDSFLGSGTTCAVAHKMRRKWIGIELGNHAYTFCKPRLDKIIKGEDKGGVSKECGWTSGGGYKFYELAPTLINEDAFGQPVINKEYNSEMLAAAVAIHEGFKYEPDSSCYWKQSKNDNNTYLYVTTKHVNEELINSIKAELKEDEYLVLVCKSFDETLKGASKNITIKKIPQSLLKNCEFGVENYNLNVICPPDYEDEEDYE